MIKLKDKRVIIFDMDGVILEESSSWVVIHRYFNVDNHSNLQDYLKEKIDYKEFMKRDISLWPRVNIKTIGKFFDNIRINGKFDRVIKECKKKGYITALVSAGLDILANKINKELKFDYVFANGLNIDKDGFLKGTGQCQVELLRKDKIVKLLSKKLNIPLSQFVVIGDSKYDIPMLKIVGLAIAFNPKDDEIKRAADIVINDKNMNKVLNFF